MKLFQFLSYRVLLISKTGQSSKKTSRITRLERGAQFPIDHFTVQSVAKRGPPDLRKDFLADLGGDAARKQFLLQTNGAPILSPSDEILGDPAVVEKALGD